MGISRRKLTLGLVAAGCALSLGGVRVAAVGRREHPSLYLFEVNVDGMDSQIAARLLAMVRRRLRSADIHYKKLQRNKGVVSVRIRNLNDVERAKKLISEHNVAVSDDGKDRLAIRLHARDVSEMLETSVQMTMENARTKYGGTVKRIGQSNRLLFKPPKSWNPYTRAGPMEIRNVWFFKVQDPLNTLSRVVETASRRLFLRTNDRSVAETDKILDELGRYLRRKRALFSGSSILSAKAVMNIGGWPELHIKFLPFEKLARPLDVGDYIVARERGRPYFPVFVAKINENRTFVLRGEFTMFEAQQFAAFVNSVAGVYPEVKTIREWYNKD